MTQFYFPITWHDELISTQDETLRRLAAGEVDFALAARMQTAGRGRRGREWQSPPGASLLCSFGLRLPLGAVASDLPFVLALALHDVLAPLWPAGAPALRLKWPNDLWAGNEKLAGLLGEARSRGGWTEAALGLGVNLRQSAEEFNPEYRTPATSLNLLGVRPLPAADALLEELAVAFGRCLAVWRTAGLTALQARVEEIAFFKDGDEIEMIDGEEKTTGRYRGLAPGGALRLEIAGADGKTEIREFHAAEAARVRLRRAANLQ